MYCSQVISGALEHACDMYSCSQGSNNALPAMLKRLTTLCVVLHAVASWACVRSR